MDNQTATHHDWIELPEGRLRVTVAGEPAEADIPALRCCYSAAPAPTTPS